MKSFYDIGKNLTDKVHHHRYDRFYPIFLESFRNQEFNMLEIGIYRGGSLSLWKEYFPNAKIYGVDVNLNWQDDRCVIYKFDQSNSDDLKKLTKTIPTCKLVVDDGSHQPHHQLITFLELFENLLDYGGIYIIEDIECNYWNPNANLYGYKIGHFNIIDYLKNIPDQINSEFSKRKNSLNISSITFGHNCVIVVKKTLEEIQLTQRVYRLKNKL